MSLTLTDEQYDEQFEADKARGIAQEVFNYRDREAISYYYDSYTRNGCDRTILYAAENLANLTTNTVLGKLRYDF